MTKKPYKVYVETVSGKNPDETNIRVHAEDPTNKKSISCLNEEGSEVPVIARRIVGIEIDDQNIVRKFIERGFNHQTQEGFRHAIAPEVYAVIGKPMPKVSISE